MDIGKLNRRVEILQFFKSRDEYGGEVGEWKAVAKAWVEIIPVSGTEQILAQQVTAEKVVKITMRYCPWLTVLHRIKYGSKVYEIVGEIDVRTAHSTTTLSAKELVSDGLQCKTKESENRDRWCEQTCKRFESNGRCGSKCNDGRSKSRWKDST